MPKLRLWPVLFVAPLSLAVLAGVPAEADPRPSQDTSCTGVWVVVDPDALGGSVAIRCATAFDTGSQALRSAGFRIAESSGMICTIDDKPDPCRVTTTAYWSYWHATRKPDGSYGEWIYSQLGADAFSPTRGDAEGWAFGAGGPPETKPSTGPDKTSGSASVASGAAAASATPGSTSAPATSGSAAAPGTPTDVTVTLGLVVIGGAGLGGWWWLKGRKS